MFILFKKIRLQNELQSSIKELNSNVILNDAQKYLHYPLFLSHTDIFVLKSHRRTPPKFF